MRSYQKSALLVLIMTLTEVVLAQTIAQLPQTMNGRWTAVIPGGRTFTDVMSVVFDEAPERTGLVDVKGHLTSRGVTCGALNEPLSGTWDGTELRFESQVHPNVNAQRANGDCGTGRVTFILTRKPGQDVFHGESHRDASQVPAQITLAP